MLKRTAVLAAVATVGFVVASNSAMAFSKGSAAVKHRSPVAAGGWGHDRIGAVGYGNSNAGPKMKHRPATKPAGGGGGPGTGWGCRTCGYSNGTQLTGIKVLGVPASLAFASVTLPSGDILDLRTSRPE